MQCWSQNKNQIETSFKLCSNTTLLISGATAGLVYARNGPLQQVLNYLPLFVGPNQALHYLQVNNQNCEVKFIYFSMSNRPVAMTESVSLTEDRALVSCRAHKVENGPLVKAYEIGVPRPSSS